MMTTKDYIILALLIVVGLLITFRGCVDSSGIISKSDTTVVTRVDTFYQDTGSFREVPVPVPYPVTRWKDPQPDSTMCQYINVYTDSLADSNLTIVYTDTVRGRLLAKNLSYKLKIPYSIVKTIDRTVTNTEIERTFKFLAGFEVGTPPQDNFQLNRFDFSGQAGFKNRRNEVYLFRYSFRDKTYNIGALFPIN